MKAFYKRSLKNIIEFKKKKIVPVNKRVTEITSSCKSMTYLWKKNLEKAL